MNEQIARGTETAYTELRYLAEGGISVERLRKILNMIYLMNPAGVPQTIVGISLNDHHLTITLQGGGEPGQA